MKRTVVIWAIVFGAAARGASADFPEGATLLDDDLAWDINGDVVSEQQQPSFAISPDEKTIAYISNGAIWKCSVTAGPAMKLVDLPNSKTAYLAKPEYRTAWNELDRNGNGLDQHIFLGKLPRDMEDVCSLAWMPSQDGLVYALRRHWQSNAETATHKVMVVSPIGTIAELATIDRERWEEPHEFTELHVTPDKTYVVASTGYAPLIWDTRSNQPLATCFDVLVPSSTSGRFLGIEIDTRQLVVTDERFEIIKRSDAVLDYRRFWDLTWSPDERYAICRSRLEHPSEKWVGFRIDLNTGNRRMLQGGHISEHWAFTGQGGEAVRAGKSRDFFGVYADGGGGGTYISIVPDGDGSQSDIVRFKLPLSEYQLKDSRERGRYPPVRMSKDNSLFAVAFPRTVGTPGYSYDLVDRSGNRWPLAATDDVTKRVRPFQVIAIANGGKTIVGCDETRLFSIPVATIKNEAKLKDD